MRAVILSVLLVGCGGPAFAPTERLAAEQPDTGTADSGLPEADPVDTGQPDTAREAAPDACATTGTGALGHLGCPCSIPYELACNGNAQAIATICTGGVWTLNQQCEPGYCDSAPGEATQGLCRQAAPGCQDVAPGTIVCITNDNARVYQTCGPDLVSYAGAEGYCPVACVPVADAGVGNVYPPGVCK